MNRSTRSLRFNLQRLTLLSACCVGLLTVAAMAQSDAAHQQFLFAYKLLQRGENQLAIEAFDDYLNQFPQADKRGDALYFSAMLNRRLGKPQAALAKLEKVATTQLVDGDAVELLRGQLLVDLQRFDQAIQPLEKIDLAKQPDTVKVSTLYLMGIAYRGSGNFDAAAKALQQAAKLDTPMRSQAQLDLARTLITAKQPDAAMKLLDQLIEQSPSNLADVARLAGDLSYQRQRYDQAARYYQLITAGSQSSPHFPAAIMGTLWSYHADNKPESLTAAYQRLHQALPDNQQAFAAYLAAVAYQRLNQHEQAAKLLADATTKHPGAAVADQLLYRLAISQSALGQHRAMEQTLMRLLSGYPKTPLRPDAMFLLAQADAKQGNVTRGAARLTEIIDQGEQHPYFLSALLQRARLYEQHNRIEAAVLDYNRYLENCEYERLPANEDGRTLFKPTQTQANILLRLLDLSYRIGHYEQTQQIADQWFRLMQLPAEVEQEVLYRVALSHIKRNQHDQAIASLRQLNQQHPVHRYLDEANYYLGLLQTTKGQPGEAMAFLKQAAGSKNLSQPLRINALKLLFLNYENSGQRDAAAQALLDIEKLSGRAALSIDDLIWLGSYLATSPKPNQAMDYFTEALQPQRRASLAQQSAAHYWRGRAQLAANQLAQAKASFEAAIKTQRGPTQAAQLWLGKTLLQMQQPMEAVGTLLPLSSDEDPAVASAALLALGEASIGQAQAARRADNPEAARQSLEQARRFLKRLVLLYPSPILSPVPEQGHLWLARVEHELDQAQQANDTLQTLIDKFPDSDYAQLAQAVQWQWQGREDAARQRLLELQDEATNLDFKQMIALWLRP